MTRSKFSETQVLGILKAVESGRTVGEVCRENSISTSTYFKWKSKFGGMEASDIRRMRELEEENRQLKRMYAEISLDHRVLKDVLEKKPWSR
jgi:putative transposase